MKFTLEDYQQRAVEQVLTGVSRARRDYVEDGERTAVGLTAPTGGRQDGDRHFGAGGALLRHRDS